MTPTSRKAIAVQCFNKADTIIACLSSLSSCRLRDEFDLIVLQDGLEGNRLMRQYAAEHAETREKVFNWLDVNCQKFQGYEFILEASGRGTAPTARHLIDHAFKGRDLVIFSEDDVIFEPDALEWFQTMVASTAYADPAVWGIAGESVYFRHGVSPPSEQRRTEAIGLASELRLEGMYELRKNMPSSVFATTPDRWAQFGVTRGEARGPRKVGDRCRAENHPVIWPIIARCRDIGMHHEKGYSMTLKKSVDLVPEKGTYIVSGDLPHFSGGFSMVSWQDVDRVREFAHNTAALDSGESSTESANPIQRPRLTFPSSVADLVREEYAGAGTILEYGTGGSTVLASEMPGKTIFGVESDAAWAAMLKAFVEGSSETVSTPNLHHVDIGPTRKWGHPQSDTSWRNFPNYALSVWSLPNFVQPDLVLIDGRFRPACFVAVLLNARCRTRILFDDYTEREHYWFVEDLLPRSRTVGRMAIFDLEPKGLDPRRILSAFQSVLVSFYLP